MTELELCKFITDDGIEIDWRNNNKHLYLWIPFYKLEKFVNLLGYNYLSEGGEEAYLQNGYICVDLLNICECFRIEPENILPKENN